MILRPQLLLMPNVPKPLHGLAPRVIMGDKWWNHARKETYLKADNKCEACGTPKEQAHYHKWMEAHELYEYDFKAFVAVFVELICLCHACHNYIHSGRMQALVDKGQFPAYKQQHILNHGEEILRKAGLFHKKEQPEWGLGYWADWRLIFNGNAYSPLFKSSIEWQKHYNGE